MEVLESAAINLASEAWPSPTAGTKLSPGALEARLALKLSFLPRTSGDRYE